MVRSSSVFLSSIFFSVFLKTFRKGKMASREADDLASVANRAEERLKALESTVFKEREEVKRERVDEKTRERRRRALSLLAIEHRRPLRPRPRPFLLFRSLPHSLAAASLSSLHFTTQLRAKLAELEAENAKLRYRVERLGAALKEGTTAAKKALEEAGESRGGDQGLRSRLGRILFGKYFIEEQE